MKVLVIGGSGMIGYKLVNRFKADHEVHFTYFADKCDSEGTESHKLDITDPKAVSTLVKELKPELVIHLSAITNLDYIEENKEEAEKINIGGTRNVVDACKEVSAKIVFFSSAAVFDGKKKLYVENDVTNPLNHYGYTKVEGEKIVMGSNLPYIIIRTDQPYCWTEEWQKKNMVLMILDKLEAGEIINELTDRFNTPTFVDNLVEVLVKLVEKDMEGVYHVVGSEYVSRYVMALLIVDEFDKNIDLIKKISMADLDIKAERANVRLDNSKARQDSGMPLLGPRDALMLLRKKMK